MCTATKDSPVWQEPFYKRLRGQPLPLFVFEDAAIPAASVWTGSRLWVAAFRAAGLNPGDRVVLALPPSPAFLAALVACMWEQLTIALVSANADPTVVAQHFDASVVISHTHGPHIWRPTGAASPPDETPALRTATHGRTPQVRFLMTTSGSAGSPKCIALSDQNIASVIHSHRSQLDLEGSTVMSILPWFHSFGLVIDLLSSLFAGAMIVREPSGGRDTQSLLHYLRTYAATHLNAVPLVAQRLASTPEGLNALRVLRGGVIGGAPINASLARQLAYTRLRVGYGMTEASPGIMLGQPGVWAQNIIGRPVGCSVRLSTSGRLQFCGPNAHLGTWAADTGLTAFPQNRWVDTQDIVECAPDGYRFIARADQCFKLSNGRMVDAGLLEAQLLRQFPGLDQASVLTTDGERIAIALCPNDMASAPSFQSVCQALGPLGGMLSGVVCVPADFHTCTPKGNLDRRHLLHRLTAA